MTRYFLLLALIPIAYMACDTKAALTTPAAQKPMSDSSKVVMVMKDLLQACWQCPKGGNCSKVASLIVYRGKTEPDRAWKSLADYSKQEDREIVDGACVAIKKVLPDGSKYRITRFQQEEESEVPRPGRFGGVSVPSTSG